jgi:hypothetical protein
MMADILVGVLIAAFGLVVCLAGLRVFFIALPIVGFIAGFYIGAAGVAAIFGDGFLSTVTGWIIGFVVGLVLGVLSYFFWYIGALLSAGFTGALIGSALMNAFGVDSGWFVTIVAAAVGVVFLIIAYKIALPVYIVVVNTAFLGAAALIAGALLIFNQIDRADLGYGVAWAAIEESWLWLLVWIVVAGAGLGSQLRMIASVVLPGDPWMSSSTK